jgi:hypothetical protein
MYLFTQAVLLVLIVVAAEFLRRGNIGEFREFRRAQFHLIFWILGVNLVGAFLLYAYAVKVGWRNWLRAVLMTDTLLSALSIVLVVIVHYTLLTRPVLGFGFALAILVFGKCATWTLFAAGNAQDDHQRVALRLYVFVSALLIFVMLAPWYTLTLTPSADEVHYTLLTYSLIHDHDFDLANNYANNDFAEQWPPLTPEVIRGYGVAQREKAGIEAVKREPHVVTNFRGKKLLWHDIGIPFLLIPGYALGKRLGVVLTLAIVGALAALALLDVALLLGASTAAAIVTAMVFTFTPPLYLYCQIAFPEIFGAAGILWIARCFLQYKQKPDPSQVLMAGIITAVLPWICIRFWVLAGPLFVVFCVYLLSRQWRKWSLVLKNLALLGCPSLASLAVFAWFDHRYFNTYLPNAGYRIVVSVLPQFFSKPYLGFLGMLFDRTYGLLPTAPLYVAGVAGLLVLFRRDRWAAAALALPCFGYIGFMSFSQFWAGGWSPPGRYVIAAVALLLPAVALVLNRRSRWILLLPAVWTLVVDVIFTMDSFARWPSIFKGYYGSGLIDFLEDWMPLPHISQPLGIYPSMLRNVGAAQYAAACSWLLVYALIAIWLAKLVPQSNGMLRKRNP